MNFIIADVVGALHDAGADDDTIDTIKRILSTNETLIQGDRPETSTAGSFGGSSAGSYLDMQASIAHQHVLDALDEMVKGLSIYRSNLTSFQTGMHETDADRQQAFERVQHGVASARHYTDKRDFHDHEAGV